jgi:hypothetical protein
MSARPSQRLVKKTRFSIVRAGACWRCSARVSQPVIPLRRATSPGAARGLLISADV